MLAGADGVHSHGRQLAFGDGAGFERMLGEFYFDSVSQVELPDWRSGRVTLAGDACQCVSLFAGQGASLALAGAFILAEELDPIRPRCRASSFALRGPPDRPQE